MIAKVCCRTLRKTKRKVSTKPNMEPHTNIMMRKMMQETLLKIALRPCIVSESFGSPIS
jgi:hypothetical protein